MKGYKEVNATRMLQRERPALNSVHRASLLVPQIAGVNAEIAFLNHFLIKRGYPHVGCRITAVDFLGKRIESQLHPVREPRVYRFGLTRMFENASAYQIEFFAAENLFVPFPAVMVNHYGEGFINTVHAFNRVLNDVFEDDELTHLDVAESGIEVVLNRDVDTVVWLMGGMEPQGGSAELTIDTAQRSVSASVPLKLPRYGVQEISLAQTFGDIGTVECGLLRVRQPRQKMFYGRVLGGRRARDTGAFSGNHSYYDTRSLTETWDNDAVSSQIFAYRSGLHPRIRLHPEIPEGHAQTLDLSFFSFSGQSLGTVEGPTLRNPGPYVEFDIPKTMLAAGLDESQVGSFELRSRPVSGNALMRVAYHIVYGESGLRGSRSSLWAIRTCSRGIRKRAVPGARQWLEPSSIPNSSLLLPCAARGPRTAKLISITSADRC
ncbi:MAG: hypothetical protein NVS9B12_06770 [Vulcanimicrobiaceae bacterium]